MVSILNVAPAAATGTGKPVSGGNASAETTRETGGTASFGAILADETAGQFSSEVTGLQLEQAAEEGGNERQYSGKFLPGQDDVDSAGLFSGDVVTPGVSDAGDSELAAAGLVQPVVVADTPSPPSVEKGLDAPTAENGTADKPAALGIASAAIAVAPAGEAILNGLNAVSPLERPAPLSAVVTTTAASRAPPAVANNTALDGVISADEIQPGLGSHSSGLDSGQNYSEVVDSVELAPSRLTAAASQSAAPALNMPRPPGGDAVMPRAESMSLPMGHESWGDELASRVSLLVKNGASEARLQLNPAGLGHLAIDIQTDGDKAVITFHAQQGATRDAIEQAMPRLREMFEQSGLQLTQSSVSDQSQSGQRNGGQASDVVAALQAQEADDSEAGLPDASSYLPGAAMASALVDYYA